MGDIQRFTNFERILVCSQDQFLTQIIKEFQKRLAIVGILHSYVEICVLFRGYQNKCALKKEWLSRACERILLKSFYPNDKIDNKKKLITRPMI